MCIEDGTKRNVIDFLWCFFNVQLKVFVFVFLLSESLLGKIIGFLGMK